MRALASLGAAGILLVTFAPACSSAGADGPSTGAGDGGAGGDATARNDSDGGAQEADAAAPKPLLDLRGVPTKCSEAVPAGATEAAALPTYAGTCPTLAAAPAENVLTSSGAERRFLFVTPANLRADERLPILFLWHWLGGSPNSFLEKGKIQAAADAMRFFAVVPFAKGDVETRWPFDVRQTAARLDEEFKFFDDMLACVAAAHPQQVNKNCVASGGVSAGALFTAQLASARSNRIASFVSMSGGTGGVVKPFGTPARTPPGLVLWGGETDTCVLVNFQEASRNLETSLTSGGAFFTECVHNCGHGPPPMDGEGGDAGDAGDGGADATYQGFWRFAFDHPFWLPTGTSPYAGKAPSTLPSWCSSGPGATPRAGVCTEPSGC